MKKMIIITLLTVTFMGVLVAGITNYYNAPVASQGTYQEITGTSAGAGGDTFLSPALDIGFTFNYCGTAYTQLKMASDGYLALGTSQTSSSLSNNLSTTSVLPIIASLWDDLTSNTMSYTTIGTEPNRVFIAQWKNTKWNYNGTAGQNFQIRLYETSDKIELIYGSMITPNSPSASIGINCSPGGSGNFYSITPGNPITYSTTTSNNSISAITYLTSGTTYTFTKVDPNAPPLPAVIVSPTNGQSNVSNLPTLSWSSGGGIVTKYLVYFGTDGGGTSTPANILNGYDNLTSTSYTFANPLTYNTTYYWQIVPYNGVNPAANCPIWSFTTMADPTIYPPFTEGFENGNTHETAVLGWTQESVSGSNVWTANNSYTNYNRTPRSGNWNAFLQYSNTRWMFKPIQLEADINYRVIIYARQDATSGASIKISYGATATAAGMTNAIISNTNITNGEYQRLEGIFTPTASGLYYIGILGTLNYSPYYLSIDDITIEEVPDNPVCSVYPESWDFGTVVLGSSATKQFTISNTGGGKLMINSVETIGDYYSISSLPTDTELEAGENTNFTVKYEPGAESKGTHQGSVVIHYGDGGEKIIPLTGTCVDATIYETDIPYTENFDGVTAPALPLGWTSYINSTSSYAVIQTYTSSSPYTTPNHIYMYNSGDNNAALILISPMIDVPLNTLRTSFYAIGSAYDTYTLNIGTMSDPTNGDTFTSLTTINLTGTYTKYTVNLNSYTGNDKYLAFKHGLGGTYRSIYIDNFLLELAPSVIEPSNLIVSSITGNSAVLGWTENNVPPATTWDIIYGVPGFNPNAKSTQIQVTSNPYTLTGLQPSTTYEWYVRAVKDGNTSVWAGPSSFTTAQIPAELPLTENFEGDINWTIVNGTQTNKWFVGSVPAYSGNSAYISKDNGTTYEYNNGSSSVVHLYRDISFPAGALEYNLSFMFKCGGESTYDGLKVFLVDTATVPTAGSQLSTEQIGNTWYNLTTAWTEKTITINNAVAGTTKRLVFSWRNDSSGGTQPPAAIDNIELTYTMPNPSPEPPSNPVPSNVATNVPLNQILSWTNNGTVTKVDVYFGLTDNMVLVSENQTDPLNSYDPELEYSKTYQWKIVAKNDVGETAEGPIWTFSTMADPTISVFPWIETFEDDSPTRANWTQIYVYGSDSWTFATGASSGYISTAHSGTKNARFVGSYSEGITKLVTPPLNLSSGNYKLSFWYGQENWYDDQNELKVYYRTSLSSNWVMLNHYTDNIDEWTLVSGIVLPEPSSTYQIAFEGINNYGYPNVLDDIKVEKEVDIPADTPTVIQGTTVTSTIPLDINETIDETNPVVLSLPNYDSLTNPIVFGLTGTGMGTITVEVGPGTWYGVIYYSGAWNQGEPYPCVVGAGLTGIVTFANVDFSAKGDVIVVLDEGTDPTLPVTLSNFTAVVTSENFVNIAWTAETETNHSGYNLYRNEAKDLDNAIKINAHLIDQGSEIGTQNNYFYTDFEVYTNIVYYYWLESVSLNGASDFYGPLTVTIGDPTQEPLPPVVPMVTKLYNAFPNPFNPNTNIRYSLKEAGKVNIEIYNMKGQRIKAYHQEHNAPGYYQVSWDGRDENGRVVSSGIYLYRLTTGKYTAAKKMILAK